MFWACDAGVYVGCMYHEYIDVMVQNGVQPPSQAFVGNGPPYLVGRLSYGFGWTGPCVSTDTACSSSLVAAHLAQKVSHCWQSLSDLSFSLSFLLLRQSILSCL